MFSLNGSWAGRYADFVVGRFNTSQSTIIARAQEVYTSADPALVAIRDAFLSEYSITGFDGMSVADLDAIVTVFGNKLWDLANIA